MRRLGALLNAGLPEGLGGQLRQRVWRVFEGGCGRRGGVLGFGRSKGSAMTAPLVIDVVSDVVCPWCFIGKRRLEQAIAMRPDIPVEIRWRPYFLNDWIPREGISRNDYLTRKFGSPERYKSIAGRVSATAAAEGLTYNIDGISR